MTAAVGRALVRGFDVATYHVIRAISPRRTILGIEVSPLTLPPRCSGVFFGRVRRALELIARYDPRLLGRIQRDVRCIGGIQAGQHQYRDGVRLIWLSYPDVLAGSAANLAMTIVHEATHGRIANCGIAYRVEDRGRIERACVRQECAFARRLPGGDELAERMLQRLEEQWWTPRAKHQSTLRALRAIEAPHWVIRLVERIGARHLAREGVTDGRATQGDS